MRRRNVVILVFITVLLLWTLIAILPRGQKVPGDNPFRRDGDFPHIIAHGGGNMEFPDNTLEAFYNAYHVDSDIIFETDVVLTKDDVVILSHDRTLDRKTDLGNESYAHEITYEELVEDEWNFGFENPIDRPNGYKISDTLVPYTNYAGEEVTPLDVEYPEGVSPRHDTKYLVTTLEDLITKFPTQRIIVEIKPYGDLGVKTTDAVLALMDQYDDTLNTYERISLASFHRSIFDYFVELKATSHPDLLFSPQTADAAKFYALFTFRLDLFYTTDVGSFQFPLTQYNLNLASEELVNTAHRHNIAVHYWTINDEDDMRKLIEIGADGIVTDRLRLLKSIIDEKAQE